MELLVGPNRSITLSLRMLCLGLALSINFVPRARGLSLIAVLLILPYSSIAHDELTAQDLSKVGFDQRLNETIPLDLQFRDEGGNEVQLKDHISRRPVIIVPLYYHCPDLCSLLLRGLAAGLKSLAFLPGRDFSVVVVSIDPREGPDLAVQAKKDTLAEYGRSGTENGWHFLTGNETSIKALARAMGFRYVYDAAHDEYAHPSGIVMTTKIGRISRYFYGVVYDPRDLRLGLVDASADEIGSPIDQLLLRCFHYDPKTGKYTLVILGILRMLGVASVIALGLLIGGMTVAERRKRNRSHRA